MKPSYRKTPGGKLRARGAGVPFTGVPGENNAITDVGRIEVGYCTLISGGGPLVVGKGPIRTGVTAIFPHGKAHPNAACYAGFFNLSGNGEMSGMHFVEERGRFDGPITITNTHSCGLARDVTAQWLYTQLGKSPKNDQTFWLPVAAETADGNLSDMNGHHVKAEHVIVAFEDAHVGAIEEGSVGGGTGMRCYEFKSGSGTASRMVEYAGTNYCVGAFVQANFGKRHLLHIAGIPIGTEIPVSSPLEMSEEQGSIIVIVATDAQMIPHQLRRIARRASFGIARSGGIASNESGDLILAFSTANRPAVDTHEGFVDARYVGEKAMSLFYEATIEAVDEAIMNSIFANKAMVGRDNRRVAGLPIANVQAILRRHGRLIDVESGE
jgi:L-aminopeptidase/D-esterase-like protein